MWQYNYGYPNELYHHGVLGMKWGVHRTFSRDIYRKGVKVHSKGEPASRSGSGVHTSVSVSKDKPKKASKMPMSDKTKRALEIGAAAAGTALAAYGAYKVSKMVKGKAVSMGQVHAERILNKQGVTDPVLRTAALNKRYNADKNMSFAKAANRVFNKSSYNYGLV